jgi:hypothetical protein
MSGRDISPGVFNRTHMIRVPTASQPIEISGRNRMMRRMITFAIRLIGTTVNIRSSRTGWPRRWMCF